MTAPCVAPCERARLIDEEAVIDLREWADMHGHPAPFPFPAGITARLWQQIERIPFRLVGKISVEQRVLDVVAQAQSRLRHEPAYDALANRPDAELLRFGALLPSTEHDGDHRPLVIHGAACSSCALVLTIGLASESGALPFASSSAYTMDHQTATAQPVFP
jgi:hypothetical protein